MIAQIAIAFALGAGADTTKVIAALDPIYGYLSRKSLRRHDKK